MTNQSALLKLALLLLLLQVYGTDAKPNIIVTSQDVRIGDEVLLLCKAGGEADIKWQKDDESISDEEMVTFIDETSSKLTITKATLEDAGKYICTCEYHSTGLEDEVEKLIYVYEGPSFENTIGYHEFLEETKGMVLCKATGKPEVEVHWFRNGEAIPSSEGERVRQLSDNALYFEKVKREDHGLYVCRAQIKGRPIFKDLKVSVVVNINLNPPVAPPKVKLREEVKKAIAGSKNNVSLVCSADGQPKPNITWSMPVPFAPSRHQYNSDHSELIIHSVNREDYGEYVCTATNKIAEDSATIMLDVFEAPEVFLSAEKLIVLAGESVSVSCNVSGHPQPELYWLNKHNGQTMGSDTAGHVRVTDGVLVIDELMPSDGGLYSCMAVSTTRNASRDVAILTNPDQPHYQTVSPGPTSVLFSFKVLPASGGTEITSFVLQWRQRETDKWEEVTIPASDPLAITNLKPYTFYTLPPDADSVTLKDLSYGSNYQLEVMAVNSNGSSIPATFSFTIADQPASCNKGCVFGIVIVIFLVVFLVVDATCCYKNRCGLLMSIGVKLFGQKVPGLKMLDDGVGMNNGDVTLKGIATPRGSMQQTVTKEGGQLKEVTCDKAPLTKHEKTQPDRDMPI
ncbi:hypothetical protein INR49_012847 [Caranx melampygus]|nr:hypothetical protein INR49_012847 [Caranx melampygus]